MEPTYPSFFSDLTNKVLCLILLCVPLGVGIFYYVRMDVQEGEYIKIAAPTKINVAELGDYSFVGENFVQLYEFCIDDKGFTWQITKDGHVSDSWDYYFLNNQCDSTNGPIVIVEMDKKIGRIFNETTDEQYLIDYVFLGRFYKGYKGCEAPFSSFKSHIDFEGKDFYTLKAGDTPARVKKKAMFDIYFAIGVGIAGIISFTIALISHNKNRKKAFLKKMALLGNNTNDAKLFPD